MRVLWDVRYDVTIYNSCFLHCYVIPTHIRRHALVEYYQISISQFAVNLFPFAYLFLFPRYPTGLLWIRQYGHKFTDDCTKNKWLDCFGLFCVVFCFCLVLFCFYIYFVSYISLHLSRLNNRSKVLRLWDNGVWLFPKYKWNNVCILLLILCTRRAHGITCIKHTESQLNIC